MRLTGRHRKIREQMQKSKPSPGQLMADGTWLPLGSYFALKQAIHVLKQEREKAGVSLRTLAKRTGIDKAALSRLENGKQPNPTMATLSRYAACSAKKCVWHSAMHHKQTTRLASAASGVR